MTIWHRGQPAGSLTNAENHEPAVAERDRRPEAGSSPWKPLQHTTSTKPNWRPGSRTGSTREPDSSLRGISVITDNLSDTLVGCPAAAPPPVSPKVPWAGPPRNGWP